VIDGATARQRHHEPPAGWDAQTFDRVTDALAAALVASWRRDHPAAITTTNQTPKRHIHE